jgi:hypothetical protein
MTRVSQGSKTKYYILLFYLNPAGTCKNADAKATTTVTEQIAAANVPARCARFFLWSDDLVLHSR